MLVSLFAAALFWNILTWSFGIPNSSSHCIIGALVGVAVADSLMHARGVASGVDWPQIWTVLIGLAISPVLGFFLAGGLYGILRLVIHGGQLFEPPEGDKPPVWWLRGLLVLTCTGVSLAHGTNDGQKSIGLIMLTVIGLMPATFALNPNAPDQMTQLSQNAGDAIQLIQQYGDDQKQSGIQAAGALQSAGTGIATEAQAPVTSVQENQQRGTRSQLRGDVYVVLSELKHVAETAGKDVAAKAKAKALTKQIGPPVHYAPTWVRVLSALCLGVGTMVGYKRVVRTLGERLGKEHMTPGQGGSAELVGAILIGIAGFTGLPVSTTHIITSGIAGTMVAGGKGVQGVIVSRIIMAWVFTLPATILIAGFLFYLLDNPNF
jgi:PiT family inorganic phosphate transporter